jgi:hypothetical protein
VNIRSVTASVNADFDDCKQAAQDAFDIAKFRLDSTLAVDQGNINTKFQNELNKLIAKGETLIQQAAARQPDRILFYATIFNQTANSISQGLANGLITSAQVDLLALVNIVIYALNVSTGQAIQLSEELLAANLVATETINLQNSTQTLLNKSTQNYNSALSEAETQLKQSQNSCHNQGSNSGG